MTRLNKQSSKKGIMLLLVLLILAMAMIFISAALLLTTSTRNRLYTNTEQSQARLTVTSASEAFWQALNRQEILDSTLKTWAGAPGTAGTVINLTASPAVPGMAGTAGNRTTVTVKAKTDELIWVDFETEIGAAKENVRMILRVPEDETGDPLMSTPFHFGGGDHLQFNNMDFGANAPADADDNYLVLNGPVTMSNTRADGQWFSSAVFIGKDSEHAVTYSGNGRKFKGDMIFLGDYAQYLATTNDSGAAVEGNVIFIGNSSTSTANAFANDGGIAQDYNYKNWIFLNRVANGSAVSGKLNSVWNTASTSGIMAVVTSSNGTAYSWTSTNAKNTGSYTPATWETSYNNNTRWNDTLKNQLKNYMNGRYTDTKGFSDSFPTTESALETFGIKDEAPTGVTPMTSNKFIETYEYDTYGDTIPAGTYVIQGGKQVWNDTAASGFKRDAIQYFFFDAQKKYTIYFGSTYELHGCVFVFVNGTKNTSKNIYEGKSSYFVMLPGVNLYTDACSNVDSGIYSTGFVSASCLSYKTADECHTAIDGATTLKTLVKYNDSTGKPDYSGSPVYNGKQQDMLFIVGVKNNEFRIGGLGSADADGTAGKAIIEANIGLYNPDKSTTQSTIRWYHNVNYVYGRLEANNFFIKNNSNNCTIPYPANPGLGANLTDENVETRFSIVDIIYYYN
ncbi:MAG: hypothetical protein IKE53_09075 [Clostridiales bacterium]|nr:hypothetical protein [Clostridiales bacterium]